MRQITFNIPDESYASFMEIIKTFSFAKEVKPDDISVSENEKKLILERIKKSNPADGQSWDDIKDSF